jgi:hypothetical protein
LQKLFGFLARLPGLEVSAGAMASIRVKKTRFAQRFQDNFKFVAKPGRMASAGFRPLLGSADG